MCIRDRLIYVAFRRYLQGVGKVRPVTFALISANLVNWFGNWALIYGKLGLPAMGVRGSALSTCVARIYMAGVLIWWAWRHERERGHPLFAHWPCLLYTSLFQRRRKMQYLPLSHR